MSRSQVTNMNAQKGLDKMTQELLFRFELRCVFDGVVFIWPPNNQPPLVGRDADEALSSKPIMCPGDPTKMLPPHIEFYEGAMLDPSQVVEIIETYIESD